MLLYTWPVLLLIMCLYSIMEQKIFMNICKYFYANFCLACSPSALSPTQLVSVDDYERWLQRGLSVAESRCEGSYHCATADCPGWCVYEDTVNTFHCPVCKKHNCLLCKVCLHVKCTLK